MRRLIALIGLLLAVSTLLEAQAWAQNRSLEGSVIRRQLLYRSNRIELEPALAHTLNDTYRRTAYLHLAANYHLTNTFALGINLGWGAIGYNSNILDAIEAENPGVARQLGLADTTLVGDFHLAYVPFLGKFNFLEVGTVNWDFHLLGGVGGALVSTDDAETFPDLDGFKFGPMIGAGLRFFFNGDMAVSVNLIDRMFEAADIQRAAVSNPESFSHHVMVTAGVSFFVTGELRVSR